MTAAARTEIRLTGANSVPDGEKQELGRRTLLRRLTGLGAAVVGAAALTWSDAPEAFAANVACCDLYYPNGPYCGGYAGNNGNFSCPSGTYRRLWTCPYNGYYWNCWECDNGSTCWNGSKYACSNYYKTNIQ